MPDVRPDVVAIVFKLKLDSLLHDLKDRDIFGKCIEDMYTIEYQKRGLPHAHILLYLHVDDLPNFAELVDELVSAQIPTDNPVLAEIVKSQMVHGSCGVDHPTSPCFRDGENSYPEYARPKNGLTWEKNGVVFDNRWVVPYNPFMTKKYNAHINAEVARDINAIKYMAKYIYKGSEKATVELQNQYDEIAMTVQGRYISPVQAVWRLMAYTTHEEKPAIMLLPFHLEGRHRVNFSQQLGPKARFFLIGWRIMRSTQTGGIYYTLTFPIFTLTPRNRMSSSSRTSRATALSLRTVDDVLECLSIHEEQVGDISRDDAISFVSSVCGADTRLARDAKCALDSVVSHLAPVCPNPKSLVKSMHECNAVLGGIQATSFFYPIATLTNASNSAYSGRTFLPEKTINSKGWSTTFASALAHYQVIDPQSIWDRFKDFFSDDCARRIQNLGDRLNPSPSYWTEEEKVHHYGLWLLGDNLRDLAAANRKTEVWTLSERLNNIDKTVPSPKLNSSNWNHWCESIQRLMYLTETARIFLPDIPTTKATTMWSAWWNSKLRESAPHIKSGELLAELTQYKSIVKIQPTKNKSIKCNYCGNIGHTENDCRKKKKVSKDRNVNVNSKVLSVVNPSDSYQLDTGSDYHVSANKDDFSSYSTSPVNVQVAGGDQVKALGRGSLNFPSLNNQKDVLHGAIHIPGQKQTILSTSQFNSIRWPSGYCKIELIRPNGSLCATFQRICGRLLYKPTVSNSDPPSVYSVARDWHSILGHSGQYAQRIMLKDAGIHNYKSQYNYEICIKSKITKCKGHGILRNVTSFGEALHMDLVGDKSVPNATWFLLAVDEFRAWKWAWPIFSKKTVPTQIRYLLENLKTKFGITPKRIHTDSGTVFQNSNLQGELLSRGIEWQKSSSHAPKQNGIVERNVRTVTEKMRTFHLQSGLPLKLWPVILNADDTEDTAGI
ncbi:hypothetical protein EPUL_004436 [Erysiphe pulchra]|uniref:Integrase catalytic domain-containing protein n=1 Tax=Erysiphe pulchra TaxID=225359 RepID=A0A2S4PTM4_9PEZI|nr:hypothetical protein EPUL_004436 [Erysiphe pulchra]